MTKTILRSVLSGALLSATAFAQNTSDFFRLEPGSVRQYRAENGTDSFTIRVGTLGIMHQDHFHYTVTGYVNRPVLVYRNASNGSLYYLDQDADQDVLLTSVEHGAGWFHAVQRACDQEGQVEEQRAPYTGLSGEFGNTLAIQYRAYGCADTGIDSERYAENLGMVQRTVQTLAGPVHYDLVHASIGAVSVTEVPSTMFSVGIRKAKGPIVIADLRWNAPGQGAVLEMPTSQEYEVLLRDAKGEVVWRWSDGQFFNPRLRKLTVRHLSYEVEIPMQVYGILRHEGVYTVEAWLATLQERQYAGSSQFLYMHPAMPGAGRE